MLQLQSMGWGLSLAAGQIQPALLWQASVGIHARHTVPPGWHRPAAVSTEKMQAASPDGQACCPACRNDRHPTRKGDELELPGSATHRRRPAQDTTHQIAAYPATRDTCNLGMARALIDWGAAKLRKAAANKKG